MTNKKKKGLKWRPHCPRLERGLGFIPLQEQRPSKRQRSVLYSSSLHFIFPSTYIHLHKERERRKWWCQRHLRTRKAVWKGWKRTGKEWKNSISTNSLKLSLPLNPLLLFSLSKYIYVKCICTYKGFIGILVFWPTDEAGEAEGTSAAGGPLGCEKIQSSCRQTTHQLQGSELPKSLSVSI